MNLLVIFLAVLTATNTASLISAATLKPKEPNQTYLESACRATVYKDVCYQTLYRYSDAIQRSPMRLARAAMALSLLHNNKLSTYISSRKQAGYRPYDHRTVSAVGDCQRNVGDSVGHISDSIRQMRALSSVTQADDFVFQMSNVQTWMSAALTDLETCIDGFQEVRGGTLKGDIVGQVNSVKKVTSNALALVNSYAYRRRD